MTGTLLEREHRRRLGVQKVREGWPCSVVAGVLDVSVRAVQQWVKAYRQGGSDALTRKTMPGRQVRGPIVVLWDRGTMHKVPVLRELARRHPRLSIELLPPYAPKLNPVEQLWNHLKFDDLANCVPCDLTELATTARRRLEHTRTHSSPLHSCFAATPLLRSKRRATKVR